MTAQKMIEGDCLEILPSLPNCHFDLVLTDPPYAMPVSFYEGRNVKRRWSDSSILTAWFRLVAQAIRPKMKPDSMLAVFANANAVAAFWPVLYEMTTVLQLVVWDKGSLGMGAPFRVQTEFVIVGSFGATWQRNKATANVFRYPRVHHADRLHQAQKPDSLMADLVHHLCPDEGRVLDPFAGSGAVNRACARLGIESVSIEWDSVDAERENESQGVMLNMAYGV